MEESINLLYTRLGWELPKKIPSLNVTESTQDFSLKVREGIWQRNREEIELYQYALDLFEEEKKSILPFFPKQELTSPFTASYHYTFDQPLKGFGWGLRELEAQKNVHRWATESNTAGLICNLQFNDYSLRCSVFIQPVFKNQLLLLVNNSPTLFQPTSFQTSLNLDYQWIEYQGLIPKSLLKEGSPTELVLKMLPPDDLVHAQVLGRR